MKKLIFSIILLICTTSNLQAIDFDKEELLNLIRHELNFCEKYHKLKEIIREELTICRMNYLNTAKENHSFDHPDVKYWSARHLTYFHLLQQIDVIEGKSLIPPDDLDF